jgi:transcriptional regulatory protein LevR
MMEIKARLELLQTTGTISKETCVLVERLIEETKTRWGLTLTEENAAALVTHVAMARDRILQGKIADALDPAILAEIKESPAYERAEAIVTDWNNLLDNLLPEAERGYLLLHLCTLLVQEENKDA